MDRSFLTNAEVIKASRDFVCVRLATYEDADEAKFLTSIYTRRGALENTVFAILAPDGKTQLARPGRRPSYRRPTQLAEAMSEIVTQDYKRAPEKRWTDKKLPELKDLDLAINVASCDGLPLIVAVGETSGELTEYRESLLSLAWNDEFAGQFVFASALASDDLRPLSGIGKTKSGTYIVEPDEFGVSGHVVRKLGADSENRVRQVKKFLAEFKPPQKSHRNHVQAGYALGLRWKTEIPVTDAQAANAAERLWGSEE